MFSVVEHESEAGTGQVNALRVKANDARSALSAVQEERGVLGSLMKAKRQGLLKGVIVRC